MDHEHPFDSDQPSAQVIQIQSALCKIMSNPRRVKILRLLEKGELSVGEIVEETGLRKAAVSQNLAPMRKLGLVDFRRDGQKIFYSLRAKKVIGACHAMGDLLIELAKEAGV
ncbi:winged helix-turn-helix transcriptional regulator [bacterium]|nr:winged helix-turn-helix transcriptional regulator [bacterium]